MLDGTSMSSWLLGGWAKSSSSNASNVKLKPSDVASATGLDQSLAQAFVSFLENESSPKAPLRLPVVDMAEERTARQASCLRSCCCSHAGCVVSRKSGISISSRALNVT